MALYCLYGSPHARAGQSQMKNLNFVVNNNKKLKTMARSKKYTKSHKSATVAAKHASRIRGRAGNVISSKKVKGKTVVKYDFPK